MSRSVARGRVAVRMFACTLLAASCSLAFSQAAATAKPAAPAKQATTAKPASSTPLRRGVWQTVEPDRGRVCVRRRSDAGRQVQLCATSGERQL